MDITLINTVQKLSVMNVTIGQGAWQDNLWNQFLNHLPAIQQYSYLFDVGQTIIIQVPDGSSIPDLSMFGEVVVSDYSMV